MDKIVLENIDGDRYLVSNFLGQKCIFKLFLKEDDLVKYVSNAQVGQVDNRLSGGIRGITDVILNSRRSIFSDYQSR
ncbi:MAG: hypothetical protein V1491_01340 [archaeon]